MCSAVRRLVARLSAVRNEVFGLGEGLQKRPHGGVRAEEAVGVRSDELRTRKRTGLGPVSGHACWRHLRACRACLRKGRSE